MRRLRAGLRGVLLGTTLLAFWLLTLGNLVSFRVLLKQRVSFLATLECPRSCFVPRGAMGRFEGLRILTRPRVAGC